MGARPSPCNRPRRPPRRPALVEIELLDEIARAVDHVQRPDHDGRVHGHGAVHRAVVEIRSRDGVDVAVEGQTDQTRVGVDDRATGVAARDVQRRDEVEGVVQRISTSPEARNIQKTMEQLRVLQSMGTEEENLAISQGQTQLDEALEGGDELQIQRATDRLHEAQKSNKAQPEALSLVAREFSSEERQQILDIQNSPDVQQVKNQPFQTQFFQLLFSIDRGYR